MGTSTGSRRDSAQQPAYSDQARAIRESAAEMLHSALLATGDDRPDWRVVASPELFTGLVSRGRALAAGRPERVPPSGTPVPPHPHPR
jgi:hypothetical protein